MNSLHPTYRVDKSYDWNYDNGPIFEDPLPKLQRGIPQIDFLGHKIFSRLGVPAGPLLNARWIKLYAQLGFDVLVYKTVRTIERKSHPAPNCAYIDIAHPLSIQDSGKDLFVLDKEPQGKEKNNLTITNSFGVPSKSPKVWMADIEKANTFLGDGQVMIVSVNGTPGTGVSIENDYAACAAMAREAGAKMIEANYSCPNVATGEGSIYADKHVSSLISETIRKAIGKNIPFFIKIGAFQHQEDLEEVVRANIPFVDGISGINTMAMKVRHRDLTQGLPGENRLRSGVCGWAIQEVAQSFTEKLNEFRKKLKKDFVIIGVGGIMTPQDIKKRISEGADIAMTATAAMWNPFLAQEFHKQYSSSV